MTPPELALGLLLVAVVTGYASWRLPRLRAMLVGLAAGLGVAALALLRSRPPGPDVRQVAEDVIDDQAAREIEAIERATPEGLARLVNEGSRR